MNRTSHKKKSRRHPATIRGSMRRMVLTTLSLFVVFLILICAVIIYTGVRQTENAARQSLSDQVYQIDSALQQVENAIDGIVSQEPYYLQSFQQQLGETDLYLISYRYRNMLRRSSLQSDAEDAFFIYSEANDAFILTAPELEYETWTSMRDVLKTLCTSSGKDAVGRWTLGMIHDRYYFIYILQGSGVSYGGCVPLEIAAETDSTWDRYLEMTGTDGEDTLVMIRSDGGISVEEDSGSSGSSSLMTIQSSLGAFSLGYQERDLRAGMVVFRNVLLMAVISLALLFVISRLLDEFSRRVTQPMVILDEKMREFRGDEETKLEEPFEFQELEETRHTFNTMTDRIRTLKMDAYEERLKRQRTEYDFLRLQIKPHFYLNCLNQIFILSSMGKTEAVSSLTAKMMEYFRYLLRQDEELVTMREEIRHIDDYLYIQKVRYPAGFHYEKEIDDGLLDARITSLLLITFIENSLKYAYSAYGDLTIRLRAEREGENLKIEISDSGPGFPEDVLELLQHTENEEIRKEDGRKCIGIRNAVQRLKYAFGELVAYITKSKLSYCCRLFETTNCSVNTAAEQVGYTNFSYFSKLFRDSYGCTPQEYRKRFL